MSDLSKRIAVLSPEQRAVFEQRLKQRGLSVPKLQTIAKRQAADALPLSFAQQRLWFLDQLEPGNPFYNYISAVRLNGPLDVDALHRSLNEIVRRHELLRTVFPALEGRPIQVIAPTLTLPLAQVDLRLLSEPACETEALRQARIEVQKPFDLAHGPLLRTTLLRMGDHAHILLFTVHHIVSDGWSTEVLLREIVVLYTAFSAGRPSPLPELPIQYADFAIWQRQWMRGSVLEEQLAYWRQQLAGAPPLLNLPTDRPRPAVQSFCGALQTFALPTALSASLMALSQRTGSTLFMTLLAAFKVLLARYTRQDDIVVGSGVANRTHAEIAELIGFFANNLVLRTDLAGNPRFGELLARVREVALAAYAHQDLPFELLVEELNPERNLSYTPLFQVVFSLQGVLVPAREIAGLTLCPLEIDTGTAKLDLTLFMWEGDGQLTGSVEYSTDLFDATTITRLLEHFQTLLESISADSEWRILDLPLLTSVERRQLLVTWNDTQTAYPVDTCVQRLFEAQVAQMPDGIAAVFEDQSLSYGELNCRANQLADTLRSWGVGTDAVVGICMDRSLALLVAILGVVKAGAGYMPLDPAYPCERRSFMLDDSRAVALLTEQRLAEDVHGYVGRIACLDSDWAAIAGTRLHCLPGDANPDSLAYVIYTSGSTGRPKGVMIPHRALVNHTMSLIACYGLGPDDRLLQFISLSFDASVEELFPTLLSGATLCLPNRTGELSGGDLLRLCEQQRITILHFPVSFWHQWVDELAPRGPAILPDLRVLHLGGESVAIDKLRTWGYLLAQDVRFLNAYGPTEGTILTTAYVTTCHEVATASCSKVPIGRPFANRQVYLLDLQGQPTPIGVPGELFIGGIGIARGYLDRPSLTAEWFVPNPFAIGDWGLGIGDWGNARTPNPQSPIPNSRLYRTGDLARYRADGNIEFLGRIDQQVKVRGFRIELEEIATVLVQHPAVQACVVLAREDTPGSQRLVAYLVPQRPAFEPSEEQAESQSSQMALYDEQVTHWEVLFDDSYSQVNAQLEPAFNFTGWNSSYTGQPIPAEEMREWADATAERILDLRPHRVLEVGCGTGLLLLRIAPHCDFYCGTDFSQPALSYLERQLEQMSLPVTLLHQPAHAIGQMAAESFDTVIINSVIQYFPSVNYLVRVLEGAVRVVAPGGSIFLGDVRSHPLLDAFHASVQLFQAAPTLTRALVRERVSRSKAQDEELVIDPGFFAALQKQLPQISHIELRLKRGQHHNELTKFRYDVVLHIGNTAHTTVTPTWLLWQAGWTLQFLRQMLVETQPEALGVTDVPNARLQADLQALALIEADAGPESVADLRRVIRSLPTEGIDPEMLWALGTDLPYAIDVRCASSGVAGYCDVVFVRCPLGGEQPWVVHEQAPIRQRPWSDYANNPLRQKQARELLPQLRTFLKSRLPDYMIPMVFMVLDGLPLTPNGKVDRRALPAPEADRPDLESPFVSPGTPVEELVAGIWAQVLGLERVGVHDNFFDLGGHSLMATQVVSRLREAFQVELPVRNLFETPTVAGLAESIEVARRMAQGVQAPPIRPVLRDQELPLSFAQQRLWFLDQLVPNNSFYNMPGAVRLNGALDLNALEFSLNTIMRRHEAIRTTFATVDGRPVQVIAATPTLTLPLVDLSALPPMIREAEVQRRATAEARRPFNLARGPLLRVVLLRAAPDEHVLLFTMHHIISDGWSMGVLVQELATLYDAAVRGVPPALPELPIQYADYAVWQREWLRGEVLAAQLAYWSRQLAGAPPVLDLPFDRPRPVVQTFSGVSVPFALAGLLYQGLLALNRQQGVTLFMTLLAAFQTLLARYSGQDDVVVGSPIAGRNRGETEQLIGFFVNTLVLRTDLSGNPRFRDLLEQVREVTLGAYAHENLPFEQLVEELQPARDLSHNPLFQVVLVLQNAPMSALELLGLTLSPWEIDNGTAKFDLTLSIQESEQALLGSLEYNTDLFDATTIARMLDHFRLLLESIAVDPDQRIGLLPLLTVGERQQLLMWNDTARSFPHDRCIHELFEAQAAQRADALALIFADHHLTYQALNQQANQLAYHLTVLGVRPGALVAVCMSRSVELIVALLGVLKAGGAYVPLEPGFPAARIQWILEALQIRYLVTQRAHVAIMTDHASDLAVRHLICLDPGAPTQPDERALPDHMQLWIRADLRRLPSHNITAPIESGDLAYVIFTSGSTGTPKGVMVRHRPVTNLIDWVNRTFAMRSADRVLFVTSVCFDLSVYDIFGLLTVGGAIQVVPEHDVREPEQLLRLIATEPITFWDSAPAALQQLTPFLSLPPARLDAARLRLVFLSGDWIPVALPDQVRAAFPNATMISLGGATEAAIWSNYYPIGVVASHWASIPYGTPIQNARYYVLDHYGAHCPIGVAGELFIGGLCLADGYVQEPVLTASKFVPDPFGGEVGGRLYATGDWARYWPDGTIEFLGRRDQQVKVRGFRVELGEIETVLGQHPDVRASAVLVREDVPGDKRLVAYVVTSDKSQVTSSEDTSLVTRHSSLITELRAFLQQRLPEYMLPSVFVQLDALPVTANGKLDRRALPPPDRLRPELESALVKPRTSIEEQLAQIWSSVIGVEQVGVHDNFFALGGDSILSIQVIARANQAGLRFTPRDLFLHPTIAGLAGVVGAAPQIVAEQGIVRGPVPLTPIQHWFFGLETPEPQHFNQSLLLELRRPLDPALLERAVQHLLEHHDVLRLRLTRLVSGWQQSIDTPGAVVPLIRLDLSALAATEQAAAITVAATGLQASLDLVAGPLLRVALFDLGAGRPGRLLIIIHHLAVDGISWRVVLEDIQTAYQQLSSGATITLPPKTTAFKQWAERLVAYAQSAELRQELDYWLAAPCDRVARLPLDRPEGANTEDSARTVVVTLSMEETHALLHEVPRAYRTQINDVLLTALAQAFATWTGVPAILMDLEGHGREDLFDDVDLSRTVGWFTTLCPVLLDLAGISDPSAALKLVKERLRRIPHRGIGYGVLRYLGMETSVVERLCEQPRAEVLFNYLGQFDQVLPETALFAPANESSGMAHSPCGHRSHLLELNSNVAGGQLRMEWTYSTNIHRHTTIATLAQQFLMALRTLIAHCLSPDAGGYTPSDFLLASLDQTQLDKLALVFPRSVAQEIEDIYPLSPMQQGMLFHTLFTPLSRVYFEQMTCTLHGPLDSAAFAHAWKRMVERHTILRTAFVWEGLDEPAQVVLQRVELPLEQHDWRGLPVDEQAAQLAVFLQANRARGFTLSQAPLMRLALIRMTEESYRLIWSFHHMLLDGWSLPLLLQDVFAYYEAFVTNRDIDLGRGRPYRDYIAWLRQQDSTRAERFWRELLMDVTAPTTLLVERTPGGTPGSIDRFDEQCVSLSATGALQSFARAHQLTLNTLVEGAWALLLSRYSGANDVIFGTTVAGRPPDLVGVESMVGLFINTLPMRIGVTAADQLLPWLQRIQVQQVDLRQYEYTPLVQVQGWSAVPRELPLFESLVVFENYPADAALRERSGSITIQDLRTSEQTNYPLTIVAAPAAALELRITYDCNRFDTGTITRMLGHLQTLLEGMITDPARRLINVPLLMEAERQQVLVTWNDTARSFPHDRCIHELFEAQAAQRADALALIFADHHLTYQALNQQANQLAYHLTVLGVRPGALVAVCMSRSVELIVALLGVLKAGGAYVPLEPSFPPARIQWVLASLQIPCLVTQRAHLPVLHDQIAQLPALHDLICLDPIASASPDSEPPLDPVRLWTCADVSARPGHNLCQLVSADDRAYVIFTSGSTGRPKGVMVRHRPALNLIDWVNRTFAVQPADRLLFVTSVCFDLSVYDIFGLLAVGGALQIMSEREVRDPEHLLNMMTTEPITFWDSAPAALQQLIPFLSLPPARPDAARLRLVFLSGDWIPVALPDQVRAAFPNVTIVSLGGATEATVWSNYYVIGAVVPHWKSIPYGTPIQNARYYILDQHGAPCPIGVAGELYNGGVCLADGYAQEPALTAQSFVPNPFAGMLGDGCWVSEAESSNTQHPKPNTRLYRTGDWARYWVDGTIEFLGRRDQQVKVRGFRVELGEIETVLAQHPNVRAAVVLAREDVPGNKRLVAYLVTSNELQVTSSEDSSLVTRHSSLVTELRTFLKERLPEYMVPSAFVMLDALPLSSNGKVNRQALPVPEQNRSALADAYVAPRTPIEAMLVSIWAQVLGLARVGVDDNFFALGGHSLLATQLISRIREAFQVDLPLRTLFEAPTVAALAVSVEDAHRAAQGLQVPPIRPISRDQELPLSFAQQRLWFLDQLMPDRPDYNIPSAVRITGMIDISVLHRSFNEIIRRHEALRTTFVSTQGRPIQLIQPPTSFALPVTDLRLLDVATREATMRMLVTKVAQQTFDLARGPLLRGIALWLDDAEYVVLLVIHHIVSDGWSMGIFIRELATLYQAFVRGQPSPLPELPIQYADFAHWQRRWLQGAVLETQLAYWRRQLGNNLPVLALPSDRPRPALQTFGGGVYRAHLSSSLTEALTALSQREGVTLFMTLLAAFQSLLARYSDQDDIPVGSTIANRTRGEVEGLIGFFVNTLVLRTDLSGNPPVRELLLRVREMALQAYAHQDLPFEKLVEELQPARSLNHTPLFQVLFALQNTPMQQQELPDLTLSSVEVDSGTTKFDLSLSMEDIGHGILGLWNYNSDLFDAVTIMRIQQHFQTLLEGIVARPDLRQDQLSLLNDAEFRQVLVDWNATAADYPCDMCLYQLIVAPASHLPDAVAVIAEDQSLTYRALQQRANQLARELRAMGAGPEIPIALCMERSLDLLVGLLGILIAGGACVPLDPTYPQTRLSFMLEDSGAAVLIMTTDHRPPTTDNRSATCDLRPATNDQRPQTADERPATAIQNPKSKIQNPKSKIVHLDADWPQIGRHSAASLDQIAGPDNLAYVIYTSGSTGQPKGVLLPHRGLCNRLHWGQDAYHLTTDDRVLHKAPISFDAAIWEIFWPLSIGATLVLARPGGQQDSGYLTDLIDQQRLTVVHFVPSMLRVLLDQADLTRCVSLRRVFCGGEALPADLRDRCLEQLAVTLHNQYGPTETSVNTSFWTAQPRDPWPTSPIGRPIGNAQIYLLDRRMQPVAIGVPGEIAIGGVGLSRGYLHQPALTAERFIPNPFEGVTGDGCWVLEDSAPNTQHPTPNTRLYRTGDRARYRHDGTIEFLGRVDQQIKVRGFRIEPGEIEAALYAHPTVHACVVVAREDIPGDVRLAAYIVQGSGVRGQGSEDAALIPDPRPLIPEWRAFLQQQLPNYMVPSTFVVLDALPLSPNGKIDRRALPAPDRTRSGMEVAFVAPRTPTEALVASVWETVLGVERVSIYDNFFMLGGHSLLATQVMSRLRQAAEVELPLRSLFETPTVAGLAEQIEHTWQARIGLPVPQIAPLSRRGALPLSFAQRRLWFLDQLVPDNAFYNVPTAVRLSGRLRLTVLARSLRAIIERHETLRTTFAAVDGQPVQIIATSAPLALTVVDLQALPRSERDAVGEQLGAEEARRSFDLARGPLLRTLVLRLDDDNHLIVVNMHHIVSDGWSMGVFIRELAVLYQANTSGLPPALSALPIQYADFADWQQRWLQGVVLDAQLAYWKRQLDGLPVLNLPTDHPRPVAQSYRGATQLLTLPYSLTAALTKLSQQENITLFMVLLSAFQILLGRYSGQTDLVIGTPIANRNRVEIEGLIGFFVNMLVLRTDLSVGPTVRELLRHVREVTLQGYAHQDVPFEMLVEELRPVRDMSRNPLFQVLFALQNAPVSALESADLTLQPLALSSETAKFDLSLSMEETADGLTASLEYSTDLFEASTITRILGHLRMLLEGIAAHPDLRPNELPILSDAEREQLLIVWNTTIADYPHECCLDHLIAEQVARTPDAVAVVFHRPPTTDHRPPTNVETRRQGDKETRRSDTAQGLSPQSSVLSPEHLTYHELNVRANRLAHHLQGLGVGPEILVAICIERSLEMLVALLGVLKAGGAYVPLDPNYPAARLAFMFADSRAAVLVTRQQLTATLPPHTAHTVCIDTDWKLIIRESPDSPVGTAVACNAAYVIYTSGTTGNPKGVVVEHRQLVNALYAGCSRFGLKRSDVLLCTASFSFDAAVLEHWSLLLVGGTAVLLSAEHTLDLPELTRLLRNVTMIQAAPGLMRAIMNFIQERGLHSDYAHLTKLLVGGDLVLPDLIRAMQTTFTSAQVYIGYGPTEGTIVCTSYGAPRDQNLQPSSIGMVMQNMAVLLYDVHRQLVPIGVVGELYLGGAGVARGYLNRPDLTAERFIPNPFAQGMGDGGWGMEDSPPIPHPPSPIPRLYRTGDLAHYLPDGSLVFDGRIDEQVKVRGYRIELGEIEMALMQHPAVREAVVAARDDAPGERRLVAYLVTSDKPQVTSSADSSLATRHSLLVTELRAFLHERLPDYMLPSAFVLLDVLPLTPNNKIDRRALPAPNLGRDDLGSAYAVPRSPIEEVLVGIWAEVLGRAHLGIHDNFFEVGGHSLLATQVLSRLRDVLQVDLPLRVLFEAPTVAELAARLATQTGILTGDIPPLTPVALDGPVPLSFAQQRLWFLNQLMPSSTAYNMPIAVRLTGPLQVAVLHHSLAVLLGRHTSLRTTFASIDGVPMQIIGPVAMLPLPLIDFQALTTGERERVARWLATEDARRIFDLERGPLLRATLLQLSAREYILLLVMHHIISDGWSMGVLMRELVTLYVQGVQGQRLVLPELPIQYTDYAIWQRRWLQGPVLEQYLAYWRAQLAELPTMDLPTDYVRPSIATSSGARYPVTISPDVYIGLVKLSRQASVTLFMTLLAAFQVLLARYSDQDDIVVGTPIANRTYFKLEATIGFFVNTLALRTNLSGNPTFRTLLEQVREVALGAYAHQDIPFEMLVEVLQPARDLGRNPLFQVLLVLQNTPIVPLELPELTLHPLEVEPGMAQFDLSLALAETDLGLEGALEYRTDLFASTTIARMLNHFQTLLAAIVANPDQQLAAMPLLNAVERHQVLVDWNVTIATYSAEICLHELVMAQVGRTPDTVAIVFHPSPHNVEHLTYHALDRRANHLARHIQALGVEPEVRVGVCVERSPAMLVALLGVLKAGGTYIPLDPAYPPERLTFMLDDAQAAVLLTQRQMRDRLPAHGAKVVCLDADWSKIAHARGDAPVSGVSGANLMYVIYTSGSTGVPKGVAIPHRNVVARLSWGWSQFAADLAANVLAATSICFDVSVFELFAPLSMGGTIILVENPLAITQMQMSAVITMLSMVPSAMAELLRLGKLPAEVRTVTLAGEALPQLLVQQLYQQPSVQQVVNLYGPTEDTIYSTWALALPDASQTVPIGRPLANTWVYLLDRWMQPVPIGVPGELYLDGAGQARGYLNRPDLTAERFVPNPFAQGMGDGGWGMEDSLPIPHPPSPIPRLYRTGDLVRYRPDSTIEYLGRLDQQVKIRGFRIELGEVAAVLCQHPHVRDAVALVREDSPGDTRLVVYVIPAQEPRTKNQEPEGVAQDGSWFSVLGSGELRAFLKTRLPDYMVPSAFVMLHALPLMPNGKLDRRMLPAPDHARPEIAKTHRPPRDLLELRLVQIWEDLLAVRPIGVTENFFDLGGHSLLAVRLVAQIQQRFAQALPLALLFQAPTIAQLADILRQQTDTHRWSPLVGIQTAGSRRPFFCLHPGGGSPLCYIELARHLGPDQPFYGLQAPGLDGEQEPYDRVERLAACYIAALKVVQPQGPYLLGGWSLGGVIAFEMAQQLRDQGHEVLLLALLDTHMPTARTYLSTDDDLELLGSFAQDLGLTVELPLPALDQIRQLGLDEQLRIIVEQARLAELVPADIGLEQLRRLFHVFKANVHAVRCYTPQISTNRITLFRANMHATTEHDDPALDWGRLTTGGVETYMIPGTHYSIIRSPSVRTLAEHLRACLDTAQSTV